MKGGSGGVGWLQFTDVLPQFYLWSLSQQTNCITNRLIIQREKRGYWEREIYRDGHKKRDALPVGQLVIKREKKITFFLCNKGCTCQNPYEYYVSQMFLETVTRLSPFVPSEKRGRFVGWSLKPERCSSSTRFRRDPWLCWTSSRCEVPSIYLLLSSSSPHSLCLSGCWLGAAALVEIHQSLDEYRMLLSETSDPTELDRHLNSSSKLNICGEKRNGEAEWDGGRRNWFQKRLRWSVFQHVTDFKGFLDHVDSCVIFESAQHIQVKTKNHAD